MKLANYEVNIKIENFIFMIISLVIYIPEKLYSLLIKKKNLIQIM